jgi:hypothetical protein
MRSILGLTPIAASHVAPGTLVEAFTRWSALYGCEDPMSGKTRHFQCPKCGIGARINPTWCDSPYCSYAEKQRTYYERCEKRDHLDLTCPTCGYTKVVDCADAPKKEEA